MGLRSVSSAYIREELEERDNTCVEYVCCLHWKT